jgi:hypothetical protein
MKRVTTLSFVCRVATIALLIASWGSLTSAANQVNQTRSSGQVFTAQVEAAAKKAKSFEDFVAAIHHVETTGRVGPIYGDGRRSLGPLQISQAAWKDALRFDPSIGGRYSDCKNLAYSTKVMRAYLKGYDPVAFKNGDWESCARLWNSGPAWASKVRLTNRYWAQVRVLLQRQTS